MTPSSSRPRHGSEGSRDSVLRELEISDPRVDPSHPAFDFDRWSQTVADLKAQLGMPAPPRAGFVFRKLTVRGSGATLGYQDTVWTALVSMFDISRLWSAGARQRKTILQNLDGVLQKGDLLLVLGRPGSGCTTFLKTVTGQMEGLELGTGATIEYRGIPYCAMISRFKGELIYTPEADQHFPHLTVGQTLEFAAAMRTPRNRLPGLTRAARVRRVVDAVMVAFGLSHVRDTIVGDDCVRGVSGGERKRVSIAEAALAEVAVSAWDNPTRGLDAASALNFVHRLRTLSDLTSSSIAAAIYQSSEAIFDRFDKVLVLHQGRQIFFGPAQSACAYFEQMGWRRHPRQAPADFLTAVTDPARREPRPGFEALMPTTAEQFEVRWRESTPYALLRRDIDRYRQEWNSAGDSLQREMERARKEIKARGMLSRMPQTVSFLTQVKLCAARVIRQLWNSRVSTFTTLGGEVVLALVVGSIFYGTPETTDALFSSGSVLFFAVLLNVLMAMTDIHSVYERRAVVRKHASWALYRPSADALSNLLVDTPVKFWLATCFNLILYFLAGLSATASQFFIFFLVVFSATMAMSMLFRTVAAASTTLAQAMAISGFLILAFVTYTGFVLPAPSMPPWFGWIRHVNPLAYAFEALLANQAHGVSYPCGQLVPPYPDLVGETFFCSVPGGRAGQTDVSGDDWLAAAFGYSYSHVWRNLGIIIGFAVFFLATYLVASEFHGDSSAAARDVSVFPRHVVKARAHHHHDVEAQTTTIRTTTTPRLQQQQQVHEHGRTFSWRNVCLDVPLKGASTRRLLDNISGWVRPGTLTALMGVSGAGKTTLLNALAQRLGGSVSARGELLVGATPISDNSSFRRDVAYVQQQDVHLAASTVREALRFSAALRQGAGAGARERHAYVEDVIARLDMHDFADAVVGVPGSGGLRLEQRKRLSIGVELVAKPSMLLFLDEPTSGLDGPSSETIVALLKRLAVVDGLAILCTIHQPSAMLFEQFDRLLLMDRGGRVAYFGDIGPDSSTVLSYFYRQGQARRCGRTENAAEYLLDVVGTPGTAAKGSDWPNLWSESDESRHVWEQLNDLKEGGAATTGALPPDPAHFTAQHVGRNSSNSSKYAVSIPAQFPVVCRRVLQQYWRSPAYIFSKLLLAITCSLLVGFSFFQVGGSIIDAQNAIFSVLLLCATFSSLVQQIMPQFLQQRALYEVRERHSNTYSWFTLLLANVLVELLCNIVLGVLSFAAYYYAVFGVGPSEAQGFVLLFVVYFYVLAGTFSQMVVAPLPDATMAGRVTTILFSMMILFAGVFQPPDSLPQFWIFMYRVSPLTYLVGGASVSGLPLRDITCSESEVLVFQPAGRGQSCMEYLEPYFVSGAPGRLLNPDAREDCTYCPLRSTSQVLASFGMFYDDALFDWVIGFAYVLFNTGCVFVLYYLFRIRKRGKWMESIAMRVKTEFR
ncbi:ABC-2 type transporter-domain-containing protein [Chaetomium sp. MPI-CAGE-AT-0009]|nr:ABC-2 type transporter-domain-containing protein [Chaetomium sp. MPI-CAGE-AT-0009]